LRCRIRFGLSLEIVERLLTIEIGLQSFVKEKPGVAYKTVALTSATADIIKPWCGLTNCTIDLIT
jgi:hypothetical protein